MTLIIAIDGPAGTGKSSVARIVAQQLNFIYVDTGAIYRALAFLALENKLESDDIPSLLKLINNIQPTIDETNHCSRIYYKGRLLEQELRSENISRMSSIVSQHQEVRDNLLLVQRNLLKQIKSSGIGSAISGAVFEGRDIGTVVFPKAQLKIFITANSQTRAQRRFDEISKTSGSASYQEILEAIEKRDERDKNRAAAPMQQASDAIVIDTSHMNLEAVIKQTLELIAQTQLRTKNTKDEQLW